VVPAFDENISRLTVIKDFEREKYRCLVFNIINI